MPNPSGRQGLDRQTKKTMGIILLAQATGMIAYLLFNNGILLTYFSKLGIRSANILIFLSIPSLTLFLFMMPFAYYSDRFGKKKLGFWGLIGTVAGFILVTVAGSLSGAWMEWCVGIGIGIFGIGLTVQTSSWFALLDPIVPPNVRGRFFGLLRSSWHVAAIVFTVIVTAVLQSHSDLWVYQIILVVVTVLLVVRIIFYMRIPEIDTTDSTDTGGFIKSFAKVVRIPDYMAFCSYIFLLHLFTGACPWIFGLLEKDVLNFSNYQIVFMGNLVFVGSLIGFYFGGVIIDRYGTKLMFLVCHLAYGAVMFLFVARDLFPLPVIAVVGLLSVCYGIVYAAAGVTITSEMMALIPNENKSLSTSFTSSLLFAGMTLSGIISGKIIDLNILNKSWNLLGLNMSNYDSLLLGCGIMVLLLIITLGLIPSVIAKAQWIPKGS